MPPTRWNEIKSLLTKMVIFAQMLKQQKNPQSISYGMKAFLYILISCLISLGSKEQISLFVAPGLMNYGGDLQPYYWALIQSNLSIGAGISCQLTNHIILRSELTWGRVNASDVKTGLYPQRNLSFFSDISELNVCAEYDLINISFHKLTPYFLAGVGTYHFNPYTFTQSGLKVYLQPLGTEGQGLPEYPDKKVYGLTQTNAILGAGMKYRISDQFSVAIEFASRYLYTDYLDDVSEKYPVSSDLLNHGLSLTAELSFRGDELDPSRPYPDAKPRGNSGATDNYYTSMVRLIYTIPKNNFQTSGGNKTGNRKNRFLQCPKKLKLF